MSALLALLAGLGLALPYVWPLAWPLALLSLWCLLELERRVPPCRAFFGWCLLAGFISELASFWWLLPAMVHYFGVPPPLAGTLVVLYCGVSGTRLLILGALWRALRPVTWWGFPLAVVAADMLHVAIFPWTVGGTQIAQPLYPQLADVVGIVGMGFPIAMVAVWLQQRRWRSSLVVLGVLLFVYVYGFTRLHQLRGEMNECLGNVPLHVALIQPSTPPRHVFPAAAGNVLSTCRTLTELALASGPVDLVVWPEGAAPYSYDTHDNPGDHMLRATVDDIVQHYHVPFLIQDERWEDGGHYNSVTLIAADDHRVGSYHKRRLLPLAEFMPVPAWAVMAGTPQYTAGDETVVLQGLSPQLCYEVLFPSNVRPAVLAGARYILNLSNDGWFGTSPGALEQVHQAWARAIEFRRPLICCANTGISTVIAPTGDFAAPQTELGARTWLVAKVDTVSDLTYYARYGDVFGWGCTVLALLLAARSLKDRPRDGIVADMTQRSARLKPTPKGVTLMTERSARLKPTPKGSRL